MAFLPILPVVWQSLARRLGGRGGLKLGSSRNPPPNAIQVCWSISVSQRSGFAMCLCAFVPRILNNADEASFQVVNL